MIVIVTSPRRAQAGGPGVDVTDFPDIPGCISASWNGDGSLAVEFDRDLTPAEEDAVRRRCQSLNSVDEELRNRALGALETNRQFRNGTSAQLIAGADAIIADPAATPRERQLAQGIKAMTTFNRSLAAQNIGLIRMALSELEDTE